MKLIHFISELMFSASCVKPDNPKIVFFVNDSKYTVNSFTANVKNNKVEIELVANLNEE